MSKSNSLCRRGRIWASVFAALLAWSWLGIAGAGTWQPVGIGDCPGRDVAGSRSPAPDPAKCDANFVGFTAVCWTTGCTYKNVATAACTGGPNPGQMYTCVAGAGAAPPRAAPPATGAWQPAGVGNCPGRDVGSSRGSVPEASKCDASFAGYTAVCWSTGCTYKNVLTGHCIGGANPGQMYTCAPGSAPAATPPAPAAGPVPLPPSAGWPPPPPPRRPKLRGKRYTVVNHAGDKQSSHEFVVDWGRCEVAELGPDFERGAEDITVETCRPGRRLIVKTDFRATGHSIHYDWVLLDNGATLAGAYCDRATCGPSIGKRAR
ncbi:MAG: hypothetical protein JXP73_02015 [Deltaproteobacteria bacterium]|nr:hypothetical protein [Deltaproteobacteria bacterium]